MTLLKKLTVISLLIAGSAGLVTKIRNQRRIKKFGSISSFVKTIHKQLRRMGR